MRGHATPYTTYVLLRIYKDIPPLTFYFSAEAKYFSTFCVCVFWANFCFQVQIMFFSFLNNEIIVIPKRWQFNCL